MIENYKILVLVPPSKKNYIIKLLKGNNVVDKSRGDRFSVKDHKNRIFDFCFKLSVEEAINEVKNRVFSAMLITEQNLIDPFLENLSKLNYNNKNISPEQIALYFQNTKLETEEILSYGRKKIGAIIEKKEEKFLLSKLKTIIKLRKPGKTAICLAGGGIEGSIYELGVLRSLDELFINKKVIDFDIFCGISAGAIVASIISNGVPPVQLTKSFVQDSTMLAGLTPRVLFDPAYKEFASRIWNVLRGSKDKRGIIIERLLSAIPNGFFKGDTLEKMIAIELSRPGRSNNFSELKKELYIGATDQDTYEHVVFGSEGWEDVPISAAVHASMALVPFYAPKWINGRWFIDGSYTKTSEIELAIEKGATLIIIVDPLIPIRAPESGYVRQRGGVFSSIQGLKALINTRFKAILPHLMESNPDVDFLVFTPQEDDMRLMAGSPQRYHYRLEIERVAYEETIDRINEDKIRIIEALTRHKIKTKLKI
jgi:NTE family protein